jgi:hypothetical protein
MGIGFRFAGRLTSISGWLNQEWVVKRGTVGVEESVGWLSLQFMELKKEE